MKVTVFSACNLRSWHGHQTINIRTIGLGNKRTSGDQPNNIIVEIRQNTKGSPGELRRFAIA